MDDRKNDRKNDRKSETDLHLLPDDGEVVVFERRLEKRLRAIHETDRPWLRKVLGVLIILGTFYLGMKSIANRAKEDKARYEESMRARGLDPHAPAPPEEKLAADEPRPTPKPLIAVVNDEALALIGDCTKASDGFRLLALRQKADSPMTLDSVFAPVLAKSAGARQQLTLQNVKIKTKRGAEWRLHAAPQGESGDLKLQLFHLADDGLPEALEPGMADFPFGLEPLIGAKLTSASVEKFLAFADPPGVASEIERRESWSLAGGAGIQIVRLNGHIVDLQAQARGKFLACTQEARPRAVDEPQVLCKCIGH